MRLSERTLRWIIREELLREVSVPDFTSRMKFSSGWIDPTGEHHFDPKLRDHGAWALRLITGKYEPTDESFSDEDNATKELLSRGWAKVSNAYVIQILEPTRTVLEAWLNLGMESGSDPDDIHTIWGEEHPIMTGDWSKIERFMRRLP